MSNKSIWINLIATGLILTSCQHNENENPTSVETLDFSAVIDEGKLKTVLFPDFSVRWNEDDAITVFGKTGKNTLLDDIELSDGGKKAIFRGEVESSSTYYAITPAQEDAVFSTGILTAEIPSTQSAVPGTYGHEAGLAVASCGSSRKLNFKQVGALIGITIHNENIASVSLYSNSTMTGTARINWNSGSPSAEIIRGKQEVTLKGSFSSGNTYWFNVFPGDYSDLQIVYNSTSGQIASFVNNEDLTISLGRAEAAKVIDITVSDGDWHDPLLAGVVRTTNSTATIAWTEKAANAEVFTHIWPKSISGTYNYANDIKNDYIISLYRDRDCKDLFVEHTLQDSDKLFTSDYPTRFCFTGLDAGTTYWFRVTDLSNGLSLETPLEVRTESKSYTGEVVSTDAAAGDVILYESFDNLLWGGDLTTFAAGYGVADENFSTAVIIEDALASGSEPYELPTLTLVKVRGNNSIAGPLPDK